jgi:hypothetical protein
MYIREDAMKTLKTLDLSAEENQLRNVKKLKDKGDARHKQELDKLHQMIARKTLEYYCDGGYKAFFDSYSLDYTTDDEYRVEVRGHSMTVSFDTPHGTITGSGSTWDYISNDLKVSGKPANMKIEEYEAVKQRMEEIQESERIVYPFHSLHRIANGYFDPDICLYNAHKIIKG